MKKNNEDLPLYEIVVDETDETGIRLVSLVADPAIEIKGLMFSNELVKEFQFKADKDKQILIGPALIPNKKILRKDESGNKYYTMFSKDTINKLVNKFNANGNNRRLNVDHTNTMVEGFISENWIVEDMYYDKSRKYGFDVPVGSWMLIVKIEDSEFWNTEIKEGGKNAFSIEGLLGEKAIKLERVLDIDEHIDNLSELELSKIISDLKKKQNEIIEMKILSTLNINNFGLNPDNIEVDEILESNKKEFAKDRVVKRTDQFYYYVGPLDEKTRDFCRYMLKIDKVFSIDEINQLSNLTGYDVFEYMGSYNCRHNWIRFRGKYVLTTPPTAKQLRTLMINAVPTK